jgi:flagellar basal-body rod protein FlgF
MSTKGIYTALSGAMAQNSRLDTIANNIANSNTPAFKRDQQVFKEYLTANEKPPEVIQVPRIVASIESFYDMQGGDKSFVDQAGTYTDYTQGGMKQTGNSLDLGLDGKGFFEVATSQGTRLTRNGAFKIDGQGQLVTKDGFPILLSAQPGTDPAQRVLRLDPRGGAVTVLEDGTVFQNSQSLGKLSVVDVTNPDVLHKQGDSLYTFKPNLPPEVVNVDRPNIKQGYLEGSNVNIVREMTDMITASRSFESAQKAIHAYDQMNDKLVNVVPKLG